MIIRQDGSYERNDLFLGGDWYNNGNYVINETTEDGKLMAKLYMENYPLVKFDAKDKVVTKVSVIELEKPLEVIGKKVELVKNGLGEWEYIYVDIPKTPEEVQQETINMLGQELVNLKIQILMGGM